MKIFVLTRSHNDYDQHGQYYMACFSKKPTPVEIQQTIKLRYEEYISIEYAEFICNGGGRQNLEDIWYHLEEEITQN